MKFLILFLLGFIFTANAFAQMAHGKPGIRPNWGSAKNVQVGTFYEEKTTDSLVWFTNAQGVLTEVFYPTIDKGQIKDAQFLITINDSVFLEEKRDLKKTVEVISPSMVKLTNTDHLNRFSIEHQFFTLRRSSTLIEEVVVKANVDGLKLFHLANPHLDNTGYRDNGELTDSGFLIKEGNTSLEINSSVGFKKRSLGYVGHSDGWQDLRNDSSMDWGYSYANDGNIATTGEINIPAKKGEYRFFIVYKFATNKDNAHQLRKNYMIDYQNYQNAWVNYFNALDTPSNLSKQEKLLYKRSVYTLKVHEDKLNPGALIASLSIPWGEEQYEYDSASIGGYHLIWPRDLYHVALAMLYAGDRGAPERALSFLKKIQYISSDGAWFYGPRVINKAGAFPQNTWVDGEDYWSGLQLDQVGYPVHLFYQLYKSEKSLKKQAQLLRDYKGMITSALNFIRNYGPWSGQERWEENFGISPSTFSVATSALYIGAKLFDNSKFGRELKTTADGWLYKEGDNIETWTFTTNGTYGDGRYYLRTSGCDKYDGMWNPNIFLNCHIANSSIKKDQRDILDQGFLKLALLGLKDASDEKIKTSLEKVNQNIRVKTPNGFGWYRYSFDAYGEQGKGRLWPLLSSEHARFEIERYVDNDSDWYETQKKVDRIIESYLNFANEGLMLPEQIFENTGEGTGAATPLAWSHAEFIKTLWSKHLKRNVENPF